jgi:catechol 2,3-dioxygenase-like lactoylglutathione lyase family enzyme
MNMKLEVMILPISDVDRAKDFYTKLGFREDIDLDRGELRVIQFTPPGSQASIIIGKGITSAEPGSAQGMVLVVDDINAAYNDLVGKGIEAAAVYHGAGGLFFHSGIGGLEPGADPQHASYGSFTAFKDPDGNGWVVQEVTERLPGR